MHAVGRNIEDRDACLLFNHRSDPFKVGPVHPGDRGIGQGNKGRPEFLRRLQDIMDQFVIISHDGVHIPQPGNKNQAVPVIPAQLIMGIVSGIAAGRIMYDRHASQLEQGRSGP